MRMLLSIAPLLLYAGIALAQVPVTTLVPAPRAPHPSPAGLPSAAGRKVPPFASPPVTLRLFNPYPSPLTQIALEWELQVDGASRQKGTTGNLTIAPQHAMLVRLPARWAASDTNEVFLQLRYRQWIPPNQTANRTLPQTPRSLAHSPQSTQPGPILAKEQLLLQTPAGNTLAVHPDGPLTFADEGDTFTINSPLIRIGFNKQTGWLQRYEANGAILLTDTPVLKSNFWLSGSPDDTAVAWQDASRDAHLQLFSTSTGNTLIIVKTEYTLPATSCLLHVSYTINAKGEILVGQQMEADSTLKGWPLPCFGMRWILPAAYDSIAYYGLGRTDQDSSRDFPGVNPANLRDSIRRHAPWVSIYHDTAGGRIDAIRWIRITGPGGAGLLVTADSASFNARAMPGASSVLLHIDSRQSAHDSIPGDNRQQSYGLPYGNYGYTFKVSPVIPPHAVITGHP